MRHRFRMVYRHRIRFRMLYGHRIRFRMLRQRRLFMERVFILTGILPVWVIAACFTREFCIFTRE
jgi:hypothetical protein